MAAISGMVVMERPNSYESRKGGLVTERILTFADRDKVAGQQMPDTIDYVMSEEECNRFPVDSLNDQRIVFGVNGFKEWNGRMRIKGCIAQVGKDVVAPAAPVKDANGKAK